VIALVALKVIKLVVEWACYVVGEMVEMLASEKVDE